MSAFFFDSHLHTPLCHHAEGEPDEYAAEALRKGLHGIIFTCHTPLPPDVSPQVRMSEAELPRYVEAVAACREAYAGKLEVRLGLEVDYYPGGEGFVEKIINRHPFDYIIGSVHPHLPEIRDRFFRDDPLAFVRKYFSLQAEAAETGLFDTIAHPDVIKIVPWAEYDRQRVWPEILRFLDRVAETGVCLELNTSGLIRKVREIHPAPAFLPEIAARGIPMVPGSDSHRPDRVGDGFPLAVRELEKAGFREVQVFRRRESRAVSLSALRAITVDWEEGEVAVEAGELKGG